MNINFGTFFLQCAAMGVWVFLAAAIYALIEKFLDKHFPNLLANEAEGASQAPSQAPVRTDAAKTKV